MKNTAMMFTRKGSILDGNGAMEELFCLKDFPMSMGTTLQNEGEDRLYDLIYEINETNGEVQIRNLIPEDDLYQKAHYNNIGSGWLSHHRAFAEFVTKYDPKKVLELGGGRGILSVEYSKFRDADWTILDPVPNPVPDCKAQYIKGFFDENFKIEEEFDAVIHTHTMEHFYDPVRCMGNIGKNMKVGSFMFFSIPNMEEMIKRRYTNVMNFEHTFYCAEPYVTYICNICGYSIVEVEKFREDHSIFYAARKDVEGQKQIELVNEYRKNKRLFMDWKTEQERIADYFNKKMENDSSDRKIYLFGAHVNTQYLLAFQLQTDKIAGIIDNDPSKQGQRLYGTPFWVYSQDILKDQNAPIIILRSGTHNREIKEGILKINATVEIWEE